MIHNYKIILSDFDGTLTHNDELGAEFFDILKLINDNEAELIIVTGRAQTWGQFFLSHLPVRFVITEGGGVIQYRNDKGLLENDYQVSKDDRDKLESASQKLLKAFPNINLSADSIGRTTDRAVELREIGRDSTLSNEVRSFFDSEGVNHSTSNVHINFWCGEVSKYKAVTNLLKNYVKATEEESIFFGDSLNDESMFEKFPNTVGVSNVSSVIDQLNHKPSVVLMGKKMEGPFGVYNHLKSLVK